MHDTISSFHTPLGVLLDGAIIISAKIQVAIIIIIRPVASYSYVLFCLLGIIENKILRHTLLVEV